MIDSGTLLQGRFLIEDKIGVGGMGAVYRAIDQKFGSLVAIKRTFYGDTELAKAFEREARLLNGLHHPILPHVSDYFSENGDHFLVMEYIEGEDLSELLKRGERFSVNTVLGWTLDLLDGLDYLHSQEPPVIHRDIKPHNMKLTSRGKIMLLDFGMAKVTSANTLATKSVFGYSRRYSPFEQIEGTGTDPRSDIFSLGASVYHLLTSEPPVDVLRRVSAIVSGKPDSLVPASSVNRDVPAPVSDILNQALALNAEHRFVSARAMWSALEYSISAETAQQDQDKARSASATAGTVATQGMSAVAGVAASCANIDNFQTYVGEGDVKPIISSSSVDSATPVGSEPAPLGSGLESQNLKRMLRRAIPASISRMRIHRPFATARPARWLPILAACLVVAVLAIYLGSRSAEDLVGGNEPDALETPSVTQDVGATIDSTRATEDAESKTTRTEGSDNRASRNQTPESVTARSNSSARTTADGSDAETGAVGETQSATSDRQINNRRSGAERPRRVDDEPTFEQPSVSSIEVIMTGVPDERRKRSAGDGSLTEDELRQREIRRIRRENRRRQNPF